MCFFLAVFFCIPGVPLSLLFFLSNIWTHYIQYHISLTCTKTWEWFTFSTAIKKKKCQGEAQTPAKTTDIAHSMSPEPAGSWCTAGTDLLRHKKGQDLSTSVSLSSRPAQTLSVHLTAEPQRERFSISLIQSYFMGPLISWGCFQMQS